LAQVPGAPENPIHSSVRVLVVDNTPGSKGDHVSFKKLRDKYTESSIISFKVQPKTGRVSEGSDRDQANRPGARVRTQTRDLIYTLRQLDKRSRHVLVMEDDFYMCPGSLDAILYMLDKAYRKDASWLAMKVSYGFNGIILKQADIKVFASYLEEHIRRRPPDHLQTEWWAGETDQSRRYKKGRPYFVFRYNLLEHIGVKSSLREKEMRGFGVCGQEMNTELMFEVDAFNKNKCPASDMYPCGDDKTNRWAFMENPDRRPRYKAGG